MREEYDFTNAKRNPYTKRNKVQVTMKIDSETIEYFKQRSETYGIPYQTLINLYLADCAKNKKELQMMWK